MLLARVQSFGRFDEITDLVEQASALTLPDFGCRHPAIRWHNLVPIGLNYLSTPLPAFPARHSSAYRRQIRDRSMNRGAGKSPDQYPWITTHPGGQSWCDSTEPRFAASNLC
jgi:hypothetical protein